MYTSVDSTHICLKGRVGSPLNLDFGLRVVAHPPRGFARTQFAAGCPMSRGFCERWGREVGIDFHPQKDRSVVTSSRPYRLLKLSRAHPPETVLRTPRSAFHHLESLCSKTASGNSTTSRSPSSKCWSKCVSVSALRKHSTPTLPQRTRKGRHPALLISPERVAAVALPLPQFQILLWRRNDFQFAGPFIEPF
jgi:hypothetical protein